MTSSNLGNVVDYLRRIVSPLPGNVSDQHLLSHFLANRDEAAFSALLKRHGPMVFGVSRGVLSSPQDAEDVVQATFLLLARKAATIRRRASVGCWLHGVARRLSLQLKRKEMARLKREMGVSALSSKAASPPVNAHELQDVLNDALQELPEKYRAALILCYLEGQTQEQAAIQLGCPLGTVRSRLAGGRKLLQTRLTRRGFTLSAAGLATLIAAQTVSARLPTKLFATTVHAAAQCASGTPLRGLVSASVVWLVKSGLHSVALTKLICVSVGIVGMGLVAGGMGLAAKTTPGTGPGAIQVKQAAKGQPKAITKAADTQIEKQRTDLFGDLLPPQSLARLGTVRLRHGDQVRKVGLSRDGKTLISGDSQGVHIWDGFTGRHLHTFGDLRDQDPEDWRQFYSFDFSADTRIVALSTTNGPENGHVEIWDSKTGRPLRRFQSHGATEVVLSPDGKVLAAWDTGNAEAVGLFDVTSGKKLHWLNKHPSKIDHVVFSADSKILVASGDTEIRFWDIATGKQVHQLHHNDPVGFIALTPDGKTLASANRTNFASIISTTDEPVFLWDVASGKVFHRLEGKRSAITSLIFSPDGKTLLSSDLKAVRTWDVTTGRELRDRKITAGWVTHMAFTSDGSTLAMCAGATVQLWNLATGKQKVSRLAHQGAIRAVAISADGSISATGSDTEKLIRLWDSASGKETVCLAAHDHGVSSLAFTPDGRILISSGVDDLTRLAGKLVSKATIRIWDLFSSTELRRISGSSFALSPDGRFLVTDSQDKFLHVWEIATGLEIRKWPATQGTAMAFSPDGRMLFGYDANNKVRFWEIATGKERRNFEGHHFRQDSHDFVGAVAFSPNGKLVAFAGNGNYIALYDMATGKKSKLLHGKSDVSASSLAFSTNSRVLASSGNGTLRLWEIVTGEEFLQLPGQKGPYSSIAFSADNKLLLTGNDDTTALVWDLTGVRTGPKSQPLTTIDLQTAWSNLSSADPVRGQKAVRTLLGVPDQTLALLATMLKLAATPDVKRLARCLMELDSELFKAREDAMRELENMGDVAAPAIQKALAGNPSLELKKRLESLLENFAGAQRVRTLRAVQALEQIGTASSQALLERLAAGVDSLLTREAKAAIERLAKLQAAKL